MSQNVGTPSAVTNKVPFGTFQAQIAKLTTKGDLLGFSTVFGRLGIGANNTLLRAQSSAAFGFEWAGSLLDNADGFSLTSGVIPRTLTISGSDFILDNPPPLTDGFTLSGGGVSKTLSVLDDSSLDQDLLTTSDATLASLTTLLLQSTADLDISAQANTIRFRTDGIHLLTDGGKVSVNYFDTPLTMFSVGGDISAVTDDPQIVFTDNAGIVSGKIGILIGGEAVGGANLQGFNYLTSTPENSYVGAYGGNVGLGKTGDGNPAADFPVHAHGLTVIGTYDGSANQLILRDETNPQRNLKLGCHPTDAYSIIDSVSEFGSYFLHLNPSANSDPVNGRVGVAFNTLASLQSSFNINGDLYFATMSEPSTPPSGVKFYSKDISGTAKAFWKDSAGTEYDLSAMGVTYTASNGVQLVSADFQLDPTYSPTFVDLTLTGISGISTITGGATSFAITSGGALNLISGIGQLVLNANSGAGSIILDGGSTTVLNQLYLSDCPLYVGSPGNELLKLDWDNVNSGMTIDSLDGVGGSSPLWINPTGGRIGFGYSTTVALQSIISSSADIYLKAITTPSTPTGGNKVYPKSDGNLYSLDPSGIEVNLTGLNIVTTSASNYIATGNEDIIYADTTSNTVSVIIPTTLFYKSVRVMNIGLNGSTVTPAATNFINSSAFGKSLTNPFDFLVLQPSNSATNMYVFGSRPVV
jgi:hypothetical protein